MLKVREAVEKEVKEKNLNEEEAKTLLVTTIKVCLLLMSGYCQARICYLDACVSGLS